MRPIARIGKGLAAALALVAIVVGVPVLMVWLGMVPTSLPSLDEIGDRLVQRDTGTVLVGVLAAGVWLCWALFVIGLVPEVVAAVRGTSSRQLPGISAFQRPAAVLVAAIAVLLAGAPGGGAVAHASPAPSVPGEAVSAPAELPAPSPIGDPVAVPVDYGVEQAPAAGPEYVVQARDTLWRIAQLYLGDPLRYKEIIALNAGVVGADNEIVPGQVLVLPTDAQGLPASAAPPPSGLVEVVVEQGDSLSSIAAEVTGDDENWVEIWKENRGEVQPGGSVLTDPDVIEPGWVLDVPVTVTPTVPPAPVEEVPAPQSVPAPSPTVPPQQPPASAPPPAAERPGTSAPVSDAEADTSASTEDESTSLHPAVFAAGGGAVLAGVSVLALWNYRRRQFRQRRPGNTITTTPPKLVGMERAVIAAGVPAMTDVVWLDEALRGLAQQAAMQQVEVPELVAARLGSDGLTLHLASARPSPIGAWQPTEDGTQWRLQRGQETGYDAAVRAYCVAPYPTLAAIGHAADGSPWLLDLEQLGSVSLVGDKQRCLQTARFIAAELAHNAWSEMLTVTMVGFGHELVDANADRLSVTDDPDEAIDLVRQRRTEVAAAAQRAGVGVLDGRVRDVAGDAWAPHVVLIAPDVAADAPSLNGLLEEIRQDETRSSVALILGDPQNARADTARLIVRIDEHGRMSIPSLGIDLIADGLPEDEARQIAQMLAAASAGSDTRAPAARGKQAWDEHADTCGGLRPDADVADSEAAHEGPLAEAVNSVLPLPASRYSEVAAASEDEVRALAPIVSEEIRQRAEQADPDLDADLVDWWSDDCSRPRIRFLGEVEVRAAGSLPKSSPQLAFHTEIVAFLTTRPVTGVPSNVYAETMWPSDPNVVGKTKVRQSMSTVRKWLGEQHVPSGLYDSGAAQYRIEGALVDGELFRRLRIRGLSRGADGIGDLWTALALVEGAPFSGITSPREGAPGGYAWLTEANARLDYEYAAMIVDVAHTLSTHHLGNAEPERAAEAAHVALKTGTFEDAPLLDLVQASWMQGREAEGERWVQQIMSNLDVTEEVELPPRTFEVLDRLRRMRADRAS